MPKGISGVQSSKPVAPPPRRFNLGGKRMRIYGAGLLIVAVAAAAIVRWHTPDRKAGAPLPRITANSPTFVGSKACASCHQTEFKGWQGSHHQLAMQPAIEASVLGNFNDARFTDSGVTSSFFRREQSSWCGPMDRTARCTTTRSGSPSESFRSSSISSRCREAGCRHSASRGTPVRVRPAVSAGSISIRTPAFGVRGGALDWDRSDLELHVRGLSFDQCPKELQATDAQL